MEIPKYFLQWNFYVTSLYIIGRVQRLFKVFNVVMLYWSLGYSLERAPMVLMALRAMTAHILSQICAVVFTSPLTSRLCSQLQELQELPTSPLRMWSSSKKHQLILTLAPGPGVAPGSRVHEADALPLSHPHILLMLLISQQRCSICYVTFDNCICACNCG